MNNSKILTMGCAVAIALAPFSVKAASVHDGLDACANAVVNELATSNGTPPDYKINKDSHASKFRLRGLETFHLDVHDPSGDEVIARADCVVDARARVKRVVTLPLDELDAAQRAASL